MRCSVNWTHYGNMLQMARKLFTAGQLFDFSVGPGIITGGTFIFVFTYVRVGYVTNSLTLEPL